MIPKLVHQTWKTSAVQPNYLPMVQSWRDKNPTWEYRFWSDDDLESLVREYYPKFLDTYKSYPRGVQRADAGRYMLLHRFGGVYADIDTSCIKSFDAISKENRIVLCEEPREHWPHHVIPRGLKRIIFNGTIASPEGHPFWAYLLERMQQNRHSADVLDATGPFLLTGCIENYSDQSAFSVNDTHLFCHLTAQGKVSKDLGFGDYHNLNLSVHHWASSWAVKWSDVLTGLGELAAYQIAKLARLKPLFARSVAHKINRSLLHGAISTSIQNEIVKIHRSDSSTSMDQIAQNTADWHLFINPEIGDYSSHIVPTLLSIRSKIVVPHCVKSRDSEESVDDQSYVIKPESKLGLALLPLCRAYPMFNVLKRILLQDVRYLNQIKLDCVGSTMILIHRSVFDAGLQINRKADGRFDTQELSKNLMECNFKAIGLPNLIVPSGEMRIA